MRLNLVLAAALALPAWGGEFAVLTNGFRLRADRHEVAGSVIRLVLGGAVTELPAGQVSGFEPDDYAPPPPPVTPAPTPAAGESARPTDPRELVRQAADRHGLPPEFVQSVARAESGYRTAAVSPKGAIGVMQLMPKTAASLDANPFDPAENIEAGVRLLRDLLVKYDGSTHRALAAYNAGSGAVDKYQGVPPYRETQLYVDRVVGDFLRQKARPAE
jgi:soluble lytic murein transglycosylase-like protein